MFNLIQVVSNAGKALGFDGAKDDVDNTRLVKNELKTLDVEGVDKIDLEVVNDKVVLKGQGLSQAAKEKILMAAGNIKGVSLVDDKIITAKKEAAGSFHTVQAGDTLGKIALKKLGKAAAYTEIFDANRPMLTDPDKIYPGQLLRIPAHEGKLAGVSKDKVMHKGKKELT
jgi:nucleoid-associated protein YgaU